MRGETMDTAKTIKELRESTDLWKKMNKLTFMKL